MKYTREMKRYLRAVFRMLPVGYPDKRQILYNLESDIELYLEEHTEADWQDVLEEFGTAVDVAGSVLGEPMNTDIVSIMQRRDQLHNLILGIIVGGIVVMLILAGYQRCWIRYKRNTVNPAVYIYDGTEVSSEVFDEKIEKD